jgi:hypothetical protein
VVLFLIDVVWVMVCVDVSVVVLGGSVTVVDTVVVTVVSVVLVELVVWPAAVPAALHARTAPAVSATDARANRLAADALIAGSLAGAANVGNTANMRHVGRPTPPFPGGVDGRIHRCKS